MKYNFITTTINEGEYEKVRKMFGKWIVSVCPRKSNTFDNLYIVGQTSVDEYPDEDTIQEIEAEYQSVRIQSVISQKISEINRYNTSSNVDGFYLNGKKYWLTLEDRKAAELSTKAHITLGHKTTEQCLGGVFYTIPCESLIYMLAELEIYALECLNHAKRQEAEVIAMTDIASVENYDVTAGYPEMLKFEL